MTRHPGTEGNDLKPRRVDVTEDVTVRRPNGDQLSVSEALNDGLDVEVQIEENLALLRSSEGFAPEFYG